MKETRVTVDLSNEDYGKITQLASRTATKRGTVCKILISEALDVRLIKNGHTQN